MPQSFQVERGAGDLHDATQEKGLIVPLRHVRTGFRTNGRRTLGALAAAGLFALPAAAMAQALLSELGARHEVIQSELTDVTDRRRWRKPPTFATGLARRRLRRHYEHPSPEVES